MPATRPLPMIEVAKLTADSSIPRNAETTIGGINQIGSIMGLLSCRGATNDETLSNMRGLLRAIETPAFVNDEGCVFVSNDAPIGDIAAFLVGATDER